MKTMNMLVINPGSTSTKVAVYENENELFRQEIIHDHDALNAAGDVLSQLDMRDQAVRQALQDHDYDLSRLDGVVGRGGMLPGLKMGAYAVNDKMCRVIQSGRLISHASNLGALMADRIAGPLGIPAIIYDAVSADTMMDVARITGFPEVRRVSFCHVLNSRAVGRKYAESLGKKYEDMRLLVAHLGGGMSISAHDHGQIVDVISDDGGPFCPERAGSIPTLAVIDMCYSGKYTKEDMLRKHRGNGGLKALTGTSDCREIERRIGQGDETAKEAYEAFAYQIAKGIGNLAPALKCRQDAIILTGGVAYSQMLTQWITEYVEALAPVVVIPGENEMQALALGLLRVLDGQEKAAEYNFQYGD
jgi:butyrate kinase